MQNFHGSISFKCQKGESVKTVDGVRPGGEVPKESVKTLFGVPLGGEGPSVFPCDSELGRHSPNKLVGDSSYPEHPSHRPRSLMGVRVDHGGRVAFRNHLVASPTPMRPIPRWKQIL